MLWRLAVKQFLERKEKVRAMQTILVDQFVVPEESEFSAQGL